MALTVSSVLEKFLSIRDYADDHLYVASYEDGGRRKIDLYSAYKKDIVRMRADIAKANEAGRPLGTALAETDGQPLIGVILIATMEADGRGHFLLENTDRLTHHRISLEIRPGGPTGNVSLDNDGLRLKRGSYAIVAKGYTLTPLTVANADKFDEYALHHMDEYFTRRLRGQKAVRTWDRMDRRIKLVVRIDPPARAVVPVPEMPADVVGGAGTD